MKNLLIITQKVDENDQLLGFFIDWIRRFSEKFEKVIILCLEKGEFKLPENVEVISLGKDRGAGKLKILFNFYSLLSTRRNDYDAVFVHMNPIWVVLGWPYWRLRGKKVFFWYTHKAITLKLRLAEKFANKVFTASKESFRLPSKKVIVTGHGIDADFFRPTNNPSFDRLRLTKILSVGRIAPVKNYDTLIEAAKILADRGVDFIITIVGEPALEEDKNYESTIRNKIKNLGLENNFNFVGKVINKDLPQYYQSHDLFIHLSKTGSLDKTLLEAMACGLTVLGSNDSARAILPPELIFDGDNPGELAGKIQAAQNRDFGRKLRPYVAENHNLKKLIDKISDFINE